MISGILFLVILKLISAPTWCFVLAWMCIIIDAITALFKVYSLGKERGKHE